MGVNTRLLAGRYGSWGNGRVVHLHCAPVYLLFCPSDEGGILLVSSVTVGGGCRVENGFRDGEQFVPSHPDRFVFPWDIGIT
jgi:hypothetical protein